jgi:hypothetical protein
LLEEQQVTAHPNREPRSAHKISGTEEEIVDYDEAVRGAGDGKS